MLLTQVSVITKSSLSLINYIVFYHNMHTYNTHVKLKRTLIILLDYEFKVSRISVFFIRSIMFIY